MTPGARPWLAFAFTFLAVFAVAFDATAVTAIFPLLEAAFPATAPGRLSWVLNAYTILYAALLLPAGRAVDRWGARRGFLGGLGTFTVASALGALAPSVEVLILARAGQAVGAALLTPAALTLSLAGFPEAFRPTVIGLWSAGGALAAAAGPGLGALLAATFGWPAVWAANLPLGLGTLVLGLFFLPSVPGRANGRVDAAGSILLVAGAAAVCAGLVRAATDPADRTLVLLGTGAVLLAVFFRRARHHPAAARDWVILAHPTGRLAAVAAVVFGGAFGMAFFSFFVFTTSIWHFPVALAGLAALPGPLTVIPTAAAAGAVLRRHGPRRTIAAGGLLFAAAQVWYLVRVTPIPDYWGAWLPGQLVGGLAIGLLLPAVTSLALTQVAPDQWGFATASNTALRQLGQAAGVAGALAVLSHGGTHFGAFQVIYTLLAVTGVGLAALAGFSAGRQKNLSIPVEIPPPESTSPGTQFLRSLNKKPNTP